MLSEFWYERQGCAVCVVGFSIVVIISVQDEVVEVGLKIQLVLFVISVGVALIGIHLGLDSRRIFIERHVAINTYERPHVIETLEVLLVDMAQTITMAKAIDGGGANMRSITYSRIGEHIDAERQIASRFLEVGLSELHLYLDPAFKSLGEIKASESEVGENVVGCLNDAMDAVVLVIDTIRRAPPI